MPNFKITNTSASSEKGARAIFLTEAGKLLHPGDDCVVNRLDKGTDLLAKSGALKIEAGSYPKPPIFSPEEQRRLSGEKPPATPEEAEAQAKADARKAEADAVAAKQKAEIEAVAIAAGDAKAAAIDAIGTKKAIQQPLAEPIVSKPNDPDMLARAQAASDAKAQDIAKSDKSKKSGGKS